MTSMASGAHPARPRAVGGRTASGRTLDDGAPGPCSTAARTRRPVGPAARPRSVRSSPASLLPLASATRTRWTSLLHQGRSFPMAVVHGGTVVGGGGIAVQIARSDRGRVKFFERLGAHPGDHPGTQLAERPRRQPRHSPLDDARRGAWAEIGPGGGEESYLAIGQFHAQAVVAIAFENLHPFTAEWMDRQLDGCHRAAGDFARPRGPRVARTDFGSALCRSLSGRTAAR